MANISITGGTLVSDIPVEKERKEVVETIATVNESNVSVKRGTLVMKRVGEMVDVIQGGIQAMQQPPQDEKAPFDPDRQFYQSFREDVTPPTEVQTTQLSGMAAPKTGQAATSPQPISSPEFKTTESPTISKPDLEDSPDVDTTAPRRLQPSTKKEDAPLNVRNNNLGNIKNIKANEWVGQTNLGTDETFANFETPQLGVRALTKVVQANIDATNTFEEYVNRYASEPDEKEYYAKNGKLMPHLKNYGIVIAASQGINDVKQNIPEDVNMLEWLKATAKAEGGADALSYFTDDIIKEGIELAGKQ